MTVTTRYEIPLSEFDYIPVNTVLEVIDSWSEEGFIAVKYKGSILYFNEQYFQPELIKII